MRSLRERTTWRLSLSEPAPGRWSSMRTMPVITKVPPPRGRAARRSGLAQGAGQLLDRERLDDVAHLDVAHAVEADAALESSEHLAGVVLEALERFDLPGPHRLAAAHQPHPRRAGDRAG